MTRVRAALKALSKRYWSEKRMAGTASPELGSRSAPRNLHQRVGSDRVGSDRSWEFQRKVQP